MLRRSFWDWLRDWLRGHHRPPVTAPGVAFWMLRESRRTGESLWR